MVQAQGKIRQGFQLHKSDVISIKIRAIEVTVKISRIELPFLMNQYQKLICDILVCW